MKISRRLEVPTGDILVVEGDHGLLEMLSIGDYGKDVNLNQNQPVPDGLPMLPLEEKWVITISTQYGCSMGCEFCDVPKVGRGRNASLGDLIEQVRVGLALHPEVKHTKRLNLHFARMGEPTFNYNVIAAAGWLRTYFEQMGWGFHPVVSTMMPKRNDGINSFIGDWIDFKNKDCHGNAGLQLSINSTTEPQRHRMFNGNAMAIQDIADVMAGEHPVGRKFTLNFAVTGEYDIDEDVLLRYFDPDDYIIKLTPMHKTLAAMANGIKTDGDYTTPEPYQDVAARLRDAGYDVLVFIASREEDEGRITCGNAVLSGAMPDCYKELT